MTEQEIKLELAKAFIMSGRPMEYSLSDLFEWVTTTNLEDELKEEARGKPIGDVISYLQGEGRKSICGKLTNAFCANDIKTVGDLLDMGRTKFFKKRKVGTMMVYGIDEYLKSKFDITEW